MDLYNKNRGDILGSILIFIFFPFIYAALHYFSIQLETIDKLVSWYLPTGLLCCLFLFFSYKLWPAIWMGGYLGKLLIVLNLAEPFSGNFIAEYIFPFVPLSIYAIAVYLYKQKYHKASVSNFKALLYLFSIFFISTFIVSITQLFRWMQFDYKLASDFLYSASSFALGDFVGFIILFPFFIVIRSFLTHYHNLYWPIVMRCALYLVGVLLFDFTIIYINPEMIYYAKSFAIIPLIWLAYKYGTLGSLMTIITFNLIVVASLVFNFPQSNIMQDQIYLILVTLTGMLIGAGSDEQKKLNKMLEQKVIKRTSELELANKKLASANQQLEESSLTDQLTGLKNRRFIQQNIHNDIALVLRKYKDNKIINDRDLIFFIVDLDHFKNVNDLYGHSAGDEVLNQVYHLLKQVFREADYFVRWGGEEFLIIARFINREKAPLLAERLRAVFQSYEFNIKQDQTIKNTCSIGFACYPFLKDTPDLLSWENTLDLADYCLYAAKNSNRNAWVGIENIDCSTTDIYNNVISNTEQLIKSNHIKVLSSFDSLNKIKWHHQH